MCLYITILLSGCDSPQDHSLFDKTAADYPASQFLRDGYSVPQLKSSKEQLNFARSYFENIEHKIIALHAVSHFFPDALQEIALAELEIAYLLLGEDHRLSTEKDCDLALKHYDQILSSYNSDLPAIAAKALWYKGWILSDLKQKPENGIRYFREIVEKYSDIRIELHSPPPWISIFTDNEERRHRPFIPKSSLSWSGMAHLEIIRHTNDREEALVSLSALSNSGMDQYLFVPSVKLYVYRYGLDTAIEQNIRAFLIAGSGTPHQRKDLQSLLTDDEG